MKKDKILMILSLSLILLVFAGTASAGEIDEEMELSSTSDSDEIVSINEDLNNNDNNDNNVNKMEESSSDVEGAEDTSSAKETVSVETDTNVLSTNPGNYSGLSEEISPGGHIELKHDYYTYDYGSTICINVRNSVIDGNGAVIDMAGSNIRALFVNASGVTIRNLTIKNVNFTDHGGAIYFNATGSVRYCNFINNKASGENIYGGAFYFEYDSVVTNCNFINNTVNTKTTASGTALYFKRAGNVADCNFTDNQGISEILTYGGAIYFGIDGIAKNCNFNNNTANSESNAQGGAIYFNNSGDVVDCNFTNNKGLGRVAFLIYGGAVFIGNEGKIEDSNFINNTVNGSSGGYGGAIWIKSGTLTKCNFTNNAMDGSAASEGGALWIKSGTVTACNFSNNYGSHIGGAIWTHENIAIRDCKFSNNKANDRGGAIYYKTGGEIENCYFTNNSATDSGAIEMVSGTVINCNFSNNSASSLGGAISFAANGNVNDCNFTENSASLAGGAIYFNTSGNIANCNFINNKLNSDSYSRGGAVCFEKDSNVKNCNFINNTVKANTDCNGGAVWIKSGNITECNFTGNSAFLNGGAVWTEYCTVEKSNFTLNSAINGSAIYFNASSGTKSIKDSAFLDNRANSTNVTISNDEGVLTISLIGNDNYINAIYSAGEVDFENVIYWGANGITNTGTNFVPKTTYEVGQNITITVNRSGIIREFVGVTNANGELIVDLTNRAGEYIISAYHDADSYYSKTNVSSISFIIGNASSMELNIAYDMVYASLNNGTTGNVTFTVTKDGEIVKNETVNITESKANLDLSNLSAGTYNITATYNGDKNYRPSTKDIIFENYEINVAVSNPVVAGEKAVVNVTIPADVEGNLSIMIDGIARPYEKVNETTYQAMVSIGYAGIHIASATVTNDPKYPNKLSDNVSFTVIIVPSATFDVVNAENELIVTLKNLDGTPIANATVTGIINGKEQNFTTDENGVFSIEYDSNLTANFNYVDKNFVTINYGTTIIAESEEVPVTPVRNATKIICENMVTTAVSPLDPKTGQYFTWRLVDGNGNPLKNTPMQIGFNGVIYDKKNGIVTDENGYARLQINLGYAGDYTFAICFLGNDSYNASFAVTKITVKEQTPQLVVPNKSYKATAKTKALTATFKTVKGTPIENKKVTFTVNGKTYNAKTNAKGVATVNVSLNKKGTYSFTVKYAGDRTYAAISKSAKLTIK